MTYFVYMLLCKGGSYYLGITNNLAKRLATHLSGKGGKYTRSHLPQRLVYQEVLPDKSSALKREYRLKKLTHKEKSRLQTDNFLFDEINRKIK